MVFENVSMTPIFCSVSPTLSILEHRQGAENTPVVFDSLLLFCPQKHLHPINLCRFEKSSSVSVPILEKTMHDFNACCDCYYLRWFVSSPFSLTVSEYYCGFASVKSWVLTCFRIFFLFFKTVF